MIKYYQNIPLTEVTELTEFDTSDGGDESLAF